MKVAKRLECDQLAVALICARPPQNRDSAFVIALPHGNLVCSRKRQQAARTPNASRHRRLNALVVYPTVS
jgi:hypothetical protein